MIEELIIRELKVLRRKIGDLETLERGSGGSGASTLDDLIDVDAASPEGGDLLTFDVGTAKWINLPPTNAGVRQTILTFIGNLVISNNPLHIYNNLGVSQTISKIFLSVETAPTGQAIIVDIHKNGTTIFTNQAHRPQIAAAATTGYSTTIDVPSWPVGEYLTAHVDQVGSVIVGANLVVHVVHE